MVRVIVDSSFLLEMVEIGKDLLRLAEDMIEDRIEAIVLPGVLEELANLSGRPGRKGLKARLALQIARKFEILDFPRSGGEAVDDYIVRAASELGIPVATNDVELRAKLRAAGIPHIYLRADGGIGVYGEL